jgi:hypothetical protein
MKIQIVFLKLFMQNIWKLKIIIPPLQRQFEKQINKSLNKLSY